MLSSATGYTLPVHYAARPDEVSIKMVTNGTGGEFPSASESGIVKPTASVPSKALEPDFINDQKARITAYSQEVELKIDTNTLVTKVIGAVTATAALVTSGIGGTGLLVAANAAAEAVALMDVGCAAYEVHDKKKPEAERNGGLTLGTDSIGNAVNQLALKCRLSADQSEKVATYFSGVARAVVSGTPAVLASWLPATAATGVMPTVARVIATAKPALDLAVNTFNADNALKGKVKKELGIQKMNNEFLEAHAKALSTPVKTSATTQTETQMRKRNSYGADE